MTMRAPRLALVLALALGAGLIQAVAAGPASAGGFTFYGSGYGHGLGLSQYGALGLARSGWPAPRIVEHYYTGVKVGQHAAPFARVRVGLLQNRAEVVLIAKGGPYDLVLENGTFVERVPGGKRRRIRITSGSAFKVIKPGGEVVGGRVWGGRGNDMLARSQARIQVVDFGHAVGHGKIEFDMVGSRRGHLVNAVTPELYLNGLSEVPASWPMEALGAQAITARSYLYWRVSGPPRGGCSCDVLPTTADGYWIGWDREVSPSGNRWVQAVDATRRQVATHQGNWIYAVYGSSSGGHTEAIRKVWPAAQDLPYLKGVCDPKDDVPDNPSTRWTRRFTAGEVTTALRRYTGDIGTVKGFRDFRLGVSGRVTAVRVVGARRSDVVQGWDIRSALGLRDTRFSVNRDLTITGRIRAKYDGSNCGPGRAKSGDRAISGGRYQIFKRGRIYVNDRQDRVVWVRGAVLRTYLDRRGHRGPLGLPVGFQKVEGGTRGIFQHGTITCVSGCSVQMS
jgi:stage II sporulation protein D